VVAQSTKADGVQARRKSSELEREGKNLEIGVSTWAVADGLGTALLEAPPSFIEAHGIQVIEYIINADAVRLQYRKAALDEQKYIRSALLHRLTCSPSTS
jgi:hypothetical protein